LPSLWSQRAVAPDLEFGFCATIRTHGFLISGSRVTSTLKQPSHGVGLVTTRRLNAQRLNRLWVFMQCAQMATRSLHSLRATLLAGKRNIPLEVVLRRRLDFHPLRPRHGLSAIQRPLHTALWPPLIFAQLLIVLWVYKVGPSNAG
jgi:hypothetical protein